MRTAASNVKDPFYENPTFESSYDWSAIPRAVLNAAFKTAFFVVGGMCVLVFSPTIAAPIFTIAITVFVSSLAIKILDHYHIKVIERVQLQIARFRGLHRYLQIAALAGVLATAIFCWQLACVLAIPLGIYIAVVMNIDHKRCAQNLRTSESGMLPL